MTDVLENDRIRIEIDPERGARIVSLRIDGHEVLGRAGHDIPVDIADGAFPMIPWAGRIRGGRMHTMGAEHQLPVSDDGNALHGLGHVRPWSRSGVGSYAVDIGAPWPTAGTAELVYSLLEDGIRAELTWDDGSDSPCSIGFHPWFRRQLSTGQDLVLDLDVDTMVERGSDGLPTGKLVAPTDAPWDDCFRLSASPVLSWPGALQLTLWASTPWWVVFNERADLLCVEPQTAPPDAFDHPHLQPPGPWPHHITFEVRAS